MAQTISIILPIVNERPLIGRALAHLTSLEADELVVVDGGSRDGTDHIVQAHPGATLLRANPGRARQMNAGADVARGEILLFAHVDMTFPPDSVERIQSIIDRGNIAGGFFKRYEPGNWLLRSYACGLNHLFLKLQRRMVGTNGIFVRREIFLKLGGFPEVPILEDLRFADQLRRCGRMGVIREPVRVSARRYWKAGVAWQILTNGRILFHHELGRKDPTVLCRLYERAEKVRDRG